MNFKSLHSRAREEGSEWYHIFLAEKLTAEAKGDKDLFLFLLSLFKENEAGHLRIELDETGRSILERYGSYFTSPLSPFVITGEGRYLYTRRRKAQEDRFTVLLEGLLEGESDPLLKYPEKAVEGESSPVISEALFRVNRERFFIITGGPGTGKTTALAGLVRLLTEVGEREGRPPLRIALAAPTGRAAKRAEQSLNKSGVSLQARTLHKLLNIRFHTGEPGYHGKNPLPADLVVVDEASMIDLRMMSLLFDALPPGGHLLLVGDKDQLPSVEAGALFSDFLSGAEEPGHRLNEKILHLKEVFRSNSTIIDLARLVIEGKEPEVRKSLDESRGEALHFGAVPHRPDRLYRTICDFYRESLPAGEREFSVPLREWETCRASIDRWFDCYNEKIVLSPSRKGLLGVERINREIGERLFSCSLHGSSLMMAGNDYELDLFNGDRGIIFLFRGEPHVFFPGDEGYRHFPLAYLDDWEYSWAQTIHKSQGSEFNGVMIILPGGAEKLLSREILYTALTRARERVILYSDPQVLSTCLSRGVVRNSRIREVLSADPSPV